MVLCQDFTLHTHTNEFDGKNTAADMIAAARDAGFKTIGISNHFIVHPTINRTKLYGAAVAGGYQSMYSTSFSEAMAKFQPHYEELMKLQDKNPDIRILRGMEVDFFPTSQWQDGFAHACDVLKPDYLIGSAHFVEYGGTVCNVHDMAAVDAKTCDEMLKIYWQNIKNLADSGLFNWLAHLDLPKKKKLGTGKQWDTTKADVVATIARTKTPVEINTSGYKLGTGQPYPDDKIMKMIAEHNVPVLISDDAHHVNQIGMNMDWAYMQAHDCGIKNFPCLQKILDFREKRL